MIGAKKGGDSMEQQVFRVAGPDRRVILITLVFVGAFVFFGGAALLALVTGRTPLSTDLLFAGLLLAAILYRLLVAVRRYRLVLRDGEPILWIDRLVPLLGSRGVPLKRLVAVHAEPQLPTILNTNTFSLGGLFGWAGAAMVRGYGNVDAYGTNGHKAVVLEFLAAPGKEPLVKGKQGPVYIVTPQDTTGFATAVQRLRKATPATPGGAFQLAELPAAPPMAASSAPAPARSAPARKRKRR
jgi:hypothetical protein